MHTMPVAEETSWWNRPAGGREVVSVAVPLVISSLSWTVMTFVDRMMLHWESGAAMAAAFSAGTLWFALACFPLGVCTYASTFVSQYFGAGQLRRIGPVTWQAVWVAVAFSPLILAAIPLADHIFSAANHAPEVRTEEVAYFRILCWGGPALLIAQALSSFYSGQGRTNVVMVVDAVFAIVNVGLDYLWIFGVAGFPALGIEGAAWATVVSLWLKSLTYATLVLRSGHEKSFATRSGLLFDRSLCRRLLRFGGPNGLQMLLDVAGFTVFIMLVGQLGKVEYEATTMAFNISSLAFMPVWGMSLATSILVGQHLGEDRDDLAARATWTTLGLSLGYMGIISLLYVFTPDLFLYGFYASESSAGVAAVSVENDPVYALAVSLLRFVAAYNLLDASLMVFAGAIKGAGDMRFVLRVSLVMAIFLALASWLAIDVLKVGIYGCWAIIATWIAGMGVIFFLRFVGGKWRSMRVIEADVTASSLAQADVAAV